MGIRFACPNGHPLHVKDDLAGKRGICPDCQVRFWIPYPAEVAAAKDLVRAKAAPDPVATAASPPRSPASPEQKSTANGQSRPVPPNPAPIAAEVSASRQQSTTVAPIAPSPPTPTTPTAPVAKSPPPAPPTSPPPPPPAAPPPPPKEVEQSEWYIRPAAGGLYGPADQQLMQQWIAEGRVGPDSHVWRTGWPDWKYAREIPEQLPGLASTTTTEVDIPAGYNPPETNIEVSAATDPHDPSIMAARYQRRKRRSAAVQQMAAVLLGLLVIVLGIVLVWVVVRSRKKDPPAETPTSKTVQEQPADKDPPKEDEEDAGEMDE